MQRGPHPHHNANRNINNNSSSSDSPATLFRGAPVSKFVLLATVLAYIFLSHRRSAVGLSLLGLDTTATTATSAPNYYYYYRYWTAQWCFGSTGELIMGTGLLTVWMRQVERELGSRQYAQLVLVVLPLTVALLQYGLVQLVWALYSSTTTTFPYHWHYSGPYPLLGAHLCWFHWYKPRLHTQFATILGLVFSEKAVYYLWCAVVASAGGWHTVAATATGVVGWLVWDNKFMRASGLTLPPAFLAKTVAGIMSRWTDPPPAILVAGPPRHAAAAAAAAAQQRPMVPPAAAAEPQPPDPAAIEQLTSMGFPRQQVVQALQATNNNVERAADRLLSGVQ